MIPWKFPTVTFLLMKQNAMSCQAENKCADHADDKIDEIDHLVIILTIPSTIFVIALLILPPPRVGDALSPIAGICSARCFGFYTLSRLRKAPRHHLPRPLGADLVTDGSIVLCEAVSGSPSLRQFSSSSYSAATSHLRESGATDPQREKRGEVSIEERRGLELFSHPCGRASHHYQKGCGYAPRALMPSGKPTPEHRAPHKREGAFSQ